MVEWLSFLLSRFAFHENVTNQNLSIMDKITSTTFNLLRVASMAGIPNGKTRQVRLSNPHLKTSNLEN
jgi:hypothetical protein